MLFITWTKAEEQQLKEHYNSGMTLAQPGVMFNKSGNAVGNKARKMGMRKMRAGAYAGANAYKFMHNKGVRMEAALTPGQCDDMRQFLGWLVGMHNKIGRVDVGEAMKCWRDGVA